MSMFFESIAALMSLLLRRVVESSLADLVSIFYDFADGNGYEGSYDLFGPLGLPLLPHPIRIFIVHTSYFSPSPFLPLFKCLSSFIYMY